MENERSLHNGWIATRKNGKIIYTYAPEVAWVVLQLRRDDLELIRQLAPGF